MKKLLPCQCAICGCSTTHKEEAPEPYLCGMIGCNNTQKRIAELEKKLENERTEREKLQTEASRYAYHVLVEDDRHEELLKAEAERNQFLSGKYEKPQI